MFVIEVERENGPALLFGPYPTEEEAVDAMNTEPGEGGCPYDWFEDCLEAYVREVLPGA